MIRLFLVVRVNFSVGEFLLGCGRIFRVVVFLFYF